VFQLGLLAMTGYLGLAYVTPRASLTLAVSMLLVAAIVVGLCVKTSGNRRRQDIQRSAAERRTEALLENASEAVLAVDGDRIVYVSSSVRQVLGYPPEWLTAERLIAITHPESLPEVIEWAASLRAGRPGYTSRTQVRSRHADGTWIHLEVIGTNRIHDPVLGALVLSFRDVSAQKALEAELVSQAFEDSLTGLPNRALFRDRMDHAVARNRRGGGRITLLLVDLDDFKLVNDTLGHAVGDELIAAVAARMRHQVRPADTLARLGGDEFAVLVEDVDEIEAAILAERLLAAIRTPIRLGNRDFVGTASIGIATAKVSDDDHGSDPGELLRDADLAMYTAKGAGRDRYAVFDPTMHADILREARERVELELALVNNEFVVYYQPIVDLPSSRLTGVEALVRWQHPQRGLLGPNTFIPLAETTGLIVPLGRWVLRQACEQVAKWHRELPNAGQVRVSVNLSARQFQYAGLVQDVAAALSQTGIDPNLVILELTESLLMQDSESTVVTLNELRDLGVRLAIDDFGTGYSSLSYLKRFPVDILKIDKSFIDGIATDPEDATLAEAMVQLGRALGLQTVAEGIETTDQRAALRTLGCEYGQGYLYAKPTEPREIEALLHGMSLDRIEVPEVPSS
jgi:diguanylate cyclase (GGDEF)-like protein/PAS domain S-box-containing protein